MFFANPNPSDEKGAHLFSLIPAKSLDSPEEAALMRSTEDSDYYAFHIELDRHERDSLMNYRVFDDSTPEPDTQAMSHDLVASRAKQLKSSINSLVDEYFAKAALEERQ